MLCEKLRVPSEVPCTLCRNTVLCHWPLRVSVYFWSLLSLHAEQCLLWFTALQVFFLWICFYFPSCSSWQRESSNKRQRTGWQALFASLFGINTKPFSFPHLYAYELFFTSDGFLSHSPFQSCIREDWLSSGHHCEYLCGMYDDIYLHLLCCLYGFVSSHSAYRTQVQLGPLLKLGRSK